jgi:hypothetical protein
MDNISPSNTWNSNFGFEFIDADQEEPELREEETVQALIEEAKNLQPLVERELFRAVASEAARLARTLMQASATMPMMMTKIVVGGEEIEIDTAVVAASLNQKVTLFAKEKRAALSEERL